MPNNFNNYPPKYLLFNQKQSKNLAVVLEIEGIPGFFGIADTYTQIRYGDAGIVYGLPGVLYGGLRRIGDVKPYMQLDSGLVIQQRIEPEQGKGNIGNITVSLIDYRGEVSLDVAPGIVVDEIMAGKLCKLYLGFTETSFPEDYVKVYQGYITQVVCPPGLVKLQISDSTNKTRQPIFSFSTTTTTLPIAATGAASGDIITVQNTGFLAKQILSPDGVTFDPTVSTYIEVDSEIMSYSATGILSSTQVLCTRAQLGTAIDKHDIGATVTPSVGFGFNSEGINAVDFALKILLSGFGAPSATGSILSFVYDYQGNFVPNEFVLQTQDALEDIGLSVGDYFYISGSASGNNISGTITGLTTGANGKTSIIQTNQTFNLENPTSASAAFRSQYDTFPTSCGVGCNMADVDVPTFQAIKRSYFSAGGTSNLRSYYNAAKLGTDLITGDIMLPLGCYTISRYGRISMAITKPPLPGPGVKFLQLDYTNVIDPDKIITTRATNQRSFYNQISYEYDYDIATQTFNAIQYFVDTKSVSLFDYVSELPISAISVSSQLGGALIAQQRGTALLERYKNCLITIELMVNWSVGSLIEVSDIVLLRDEGNLQIMNFETGLRNIGTQLFEVIDRNYNIVSGNVKLKLLGGLGFNLNSRFGLYSPSTTLGPSCSTTLLNLTPSWGQQTVQQEFQKWSPLVGMPIMVHNYDFSVTGTSVIQVANPANPYAINVSPPLPFAPPSGYILDIAPYPTDNVASEQALLKLLYAHYSPTILITSGVSNTKFNVAASGAGLLVVSNTNTVIVRDTFYNSQSPEQSVIGITGTLVQVGGSLGFTPSATGFYVEGVGFKDDQNYYRYS